MIKVVKCKKCVLVARHDHEAQNKCPVCYSRDVEPVSEDIETSILINLLLEEVGKHISGKDIAKILALAETKTEEKY